MKPPDWLQVKGLVRFGNRVWLVERIDGDRAYLVSQGITARVLFDELRQPAADDRVETALTDGEASADRKPAWQEAVIAQVALETGAADAVRAARAALCSGLDVPDVQDLAAIATLANGIITARCYAELREQQNELIALQRLALERG